MGIRETRLENDFNEVSQLIANSGGTIALISSQGKPAYEYVIEYRCKGIERLQGNDPVFRTNHQVQIILSNDYPRNSPSAKFLTPIFHPNVFFTPRCLSGFLLDNGRKSF
jgi:ubiquitin-protein ligase